MFKKFKPFSGFCPVPVLPSSQVAATSYMQHLAYLEWYIEQMREHFETHDSDFDTAIEQLQNADESIVGDIELLDGRVEALEQSGVSGTPQICSAAGLYSGTPLDGTDMVPLFLSSVGTTTDKITIANGVAVIGNGVSSIRVFGGMIVGYTGGGATIGCSVTRDGVALLTGTTYAPLEGTLSSVTVNLNDHVIAVSPGDELTFGIWSYSTLANSVTQVHICFEVVE